MNEVPWEKFGLSERNGHLIHDVLARFGEVDEAVLFGSRAKGCYKNGSDIDLAVKGAVGKDTQAQLLAAFEESLLPYFVDVVVYSHLRNDALREHIDRVGVCVYRNFFGRG